MIRTKSRLIEDLPNEEYSTSDYEKEEDLDDEEEEGHEDVSYKNRGGNTFTMLKWLALISTIVALTCTLCIPAMRKQTVWDLPLWKWEIMALAIMGGNLVSDCGVKLIVILIERNFLLQKRVLYFVYGLKKPVQNCIWLGLVLLVWHWVFNDKIKEHTQSKILPYGTKILACLLVGTSIWLVKTLFVKGLASSFHENTFFERIQVALFNQYVIETLSGPPVFEEVQSEMSSRRKMLQKCSTIGGNMSRLSRTVSSRRNEEITIDELQNLSKKNISTWTMRRMINIVRRGSLSTLDEHILDSDMKDESSLHIRSVCQAKEAAKKIFANVAATPGSQYIFIGDLLLFMAKEEALRAMHHFGPSSEDKGISRSLLTEWLVNAFRDRQALALSLNDTKTAVDELHSMLNVIVVVIIVIIWLVMLGIPITHFLVLLSSQLLLVAFIFGNSCKTTFEAIIFLFVMHPFDVGDLCEVDGTQMRVEEMNILTTVFLKSDYQKITFPNSVLSTKPISNYYRSPDMVETIHFCVHISTPMDKISAMSDRLKAYVERHNQYWYPTASVFIYEVEDMNKLKIQVSVRHRMNFQHMEDRFTRRGHLIQEIIRMFQDLEVGYRILPLDVNVRNLHD
ncbi:Mechanosensitive ion channel protein 8 [Linum perenne]